MKTDFAAILKDAEKWDEREFGASIEHAKLASDELSASVDEQLSLQAISIRLPRSLIKDLKEIASRYDIGYQPMVRDLLNRFARAEQKKYLNMRLSQLNEIEDGRGDTVPVSDFLSDMKKQA